MAEQQQQHPRKTYEERQQARQIWLNRSIDNLKAGGYATIQQKTQDTADTRNFINIIDSLMDHVRRYAGIRGSGISSDDLKEYVGRIEKAKDDLNQLAAEMCRDLGRKYRPPRGYTNPLQQAAPTAKSEKKAEKKAAAKDKGGKEKQSVPAVAQADVATGETAAAA